jgi:beta-barrel assembly-enhancing protease
MRMISPKNIIASTAACAAIMIASYSIAAPAQADIEAYRALIEQDLRLATTGYRLAAVNAPFCKRKERNPGWVIHDIAQYPNAEIAKAAFGFEMPIQVAAVVQNGPADQADIKSNDGFIGMSDATFYWPAFPLGKRGDERIISFKQLLDERMPEKTGLAMRFSRSGAKFNTTLSPPPVCASDFQIDTVNGKDAGADGHMVSVSIGLARYAANDDEFAFIVAHEMAHNILGHRAQLDAANARKNSKAVLATEVEADRLSVWLMSNARYDPNGATRFAARCRKDSCLGLFTDSKHLGWKKRAEIMQAEIDAIRAAPEKQLAIDTVVMPPLLQGR